MSQRLIYKYRQFEAQFSSDNKMATSTDIKQVADQQFIGTFKEFEKDEEWERVREKNPKEPPKDISIDFDKKSIEQETQESISTEKTTNTYTVGPNDWDKIADTKDDANVINKIEDVLKLDKSNFEKATIVQKLMSDWTFDGLSAS